MMQVYQLTDKVDIDAVKELCKEGIFLTGLIRLAPEFQTYGPLVVEKLSKKFGMNEGALFFVDPGLVCLCLSESSGYSPSTIRREVAIELKDIHCQLNFRHTSPELLETISNELAKDASERAALFRERAERSQKRYMVVDDDMFIRQVMNTHLADHGEVQEFSDGLKAAESYAEVNPDVVYLDIHIHGIDGLEVMKRIQELDLDAKIVILSSDTSTSKVMLAQNSGACTFLKKPATPERISETIKLAYFDI